MCYSYPFWSVWYTCWVHECKNMSYGTACLGLIKQTWKVLHRCCRKGRKARTLSYYIDPIFYWGSWSHHNSTAWSSSAIRFKHPISFQFWCGNKFWQLTWLTGFDCTTTKLAKTMLWPLQPRARTTLPQKLALLWAGEGLGLCTILIAHVVIDGWGLKILLCINTNKENKGKLNLCSLKWSSPTAFQGFDWQDFFEVPDVILVATMPDAPHSPLWSSSKEGRKEGRRSSRALGWLEMVTSTFSLSLWEFLLHMGTSWSVEIVRGCPTRSQFNAVAQQLLCKISFSQTLLLNNNNSLSLSLSFSLCTQFVCNCGESKHPSGIHQLN